MPAHMCARKVMSMVVVGAQGLGNTAWALSTLSLHEGPLLDASACLTLSAVGNFRSQELSNMVWALANLGISHIPLMEAISPAARAKITDFGVQDLTNSSWAFSPLLL
eukprot:gnl/MRDRNA2_/MRDRNA2_79476_c0_seq1.p2 gnl/MRDRNA2_/MRDRNA2_79476_c0~~gnl/MRDRNA2_/MRDRNA2_79476_c0_seq1.p2  ORF type:complete len:125 (+),score=12.69 gnl/MRDRNA2_/MRDRNA2_79476_c0_seq1:52-375(+)